MRFISGRTVGLAIIGFGALALAGCGGDMETGTPAAGGGKAMAIIKNPAGGTVGRASATEVSDGLRIALDVRGMTPGTHGVHIHTVGKCDGPDFTTAGGHWNPAGKKHGSMNPQGPHEGDLPNLIIDTSRRGHLGEVLAGGTLAGLLDQDGGAIVVHAGPDDLMTDPSGNSGGRIACGVFEPA